MKLHLFLAVMSLAVGAWAADRDEIAVELFDGSTAVAIEYQGKYYERTRIWPDGMDELATRTAAMVDRMNARPLPGIYHKRMPKEPKTEWIKRINFDPVGSAELVGYSDGSVKWRPRP